MFETGGIAQSERTVIINKPIEKVGALLDVKCKTGGYWDDCIQNLIYVYAATNGILNSLGAKMTVQLAIHDIHSTEVNIKGSGLSGSVTSNANIDSYIIDLIKYLNNTEAPVPQPTPSKTCETAPQPVKKGSYDFLWVMLALLATIGGIVIYFMYFYN